jgi:hypothetical protein
MKTPTLVTFIISNLIADIVLAWKWGRITTTEAMKQANCRFEDQWLELVRRTER